MSEEKKSSPTEEDNKKESEQARDAAAEASFDEKRAAYMIAWRDTYMEKQRQIIAAYEQKDALYNALLAYAMLQAAKEGATENRLVIPRRALKEMLFAFECEILQDEQDYTLLFHRREEVAHAGAGAQE